MQHGWNRSVIEEEFGGNANGLEKAGLGAAIESLVKPHGANIPPLLSGKTRIFGPSGAAQWPPARPFRGAVVFVIQA